MITKDLTIHRIELSESLDVWKERRRELRSLLSISVWDLMAEHNCYVAGGSVSSVFSGRSFDEYDVFARTEKDAKRLSMALGKVPGFQQATITERAVTFGYPINSTMPDMQIQVIYIPDRIGRPEYVIRSFDFVACMGAYDPKTDEFILAEGFVGNNIDKVLIYNHAAIYPLNSLLRIPKYIKKGYYIDKFNLLQIALRICAINMCDLGEVARQCAATYNADGEIQRMMCDDLSQILCGDFND